MIRRLCFVNYLGIKHDRTAIVAMQGYDASIADVGYCTFVKVAALIIAIYEGNMLTLYDCVA
jgi:hypothetical protein